jgi:TonB-dependent receptor
MRITSSVRTLLVCSAATGALAIAAPALAQEEPAAEDEIVVTGSILQAQIASVEEKRRALNLVDVAAADSVGRFPDQNSAAALSRLPAVAVQRDQGQERYIQIRGAPNRWTSVTIDGVPMVGVDEGGDSRAYRFDAVPAVLLSAMVINKSLTPALQADAIVATVDLQTYSPLSRKGFHVTGDLGYGFMDLGKGEQRQGSLRVSWANDEFGIVLGGSHYRRKQLTDNREVGLFDEPSSATDVTFGPTEVDIRQYEIERWNNGLFAGLEYSPEDGKRIFVKGIYTEFGDDEQRHQYEARLDRAASGFRNLDGGDLVAVPFRGSFNYGEYRTKNYIGTIGGDIETDDDFKISLRANYAKTDNDTYLPLVQASTSSGLGSPSLTYDRSDPRFPILTLYQTVAGPTPGTFARGPALAGFDQRSLAAAGALYIAAVQKTVSDSYTVKLDMEKQLGDLTLAWGGLYADRTIVGNNFSTANTAQLAALGTAVGQPFNVNSYVTNRPWDTGFPLGFTLNYVDNRTMRNDILSILAKATAAGSFNPANDIPVTDLYDQAEQTYAGYAMATAELGRVTLIGGVRVEHYALDNVGTARNGTVLTPLSVRKTYTDFFPSLNARAELTDNLVFRLAGQRGISRPAYGSIRVGSAINDALGTIGGGNPDLEPEYTWGLDTSLEFYLPGNGILSAAAFHRWVDNVFYGNTERVGNDRFDSNGVDRSNFVLTGTFNGQNGRLYGAEFNYQQQFSFLPSPFDGLGFQGNLTLLDGEFDAEFVSPTTGATVLREGIAFPGMSKRIVNASVFYEKYGLSARVSYQWRSDWLDSIGGLGAGESRQGYENLDVSVRYQINDTFTVFADLSNLTDAKYIAYEGTRERPSEVEQIGSRYLFGIRFDF